MRYLERSSFFGKVKKRLVLNSYQVIRTKEQIIALSQKRTSYIFGSPQLNQNFKISDYENQFFRKLY